MTQTTPKESQDLKNYQKPITKVVDAKYVSEYKILVSFSGLTQQTVDFGPFLANHPHPQYNKYKNPVHFRKFTIECGNTVWAKDWDPVFPVGQLHAGEID